MHKVDFETKNYQLSGRIKYDRVTAADLDLIYGWQLIPEIRQFSLIKTPPTYEEHKKWFNDKINSSNSIFEKILFDDQPCGTLRLDYLEYAYWLLSWYILPEFQNRGIGTYVLGLAKELAMGRPIRAFVLQENKRSHNAMRKAAFHVLSEENKGIWYVFDNKNG